MKKIRALLLLLMIAVLAACSAATTGGYNFVNQTLQGKIDGVSWTFVDGAADTQGHSNDIWFDLYNTTATGDPFTGFPSGVDKVMFTFTPAAVGLHELQLGSNQQTVTLYEAAGSNNWICTEGAVEILTIDTLGGTLTGRMDVRFDSNTYVNGNFTAHYR